MPVIVPGVYPGEGVIAPQPVSKISKVKINKIGKMVLKLNFI
jgi:hypothetical protein